MPRKIAFVDDEEQILRALKRLFFGTEYDCVYFNKPIDLISYLENETIDILVTDIRMPEMDGIELMYHVRTIKPEVIRIALSGYTDSRQIMAALDTGLARLYIYKPWDNDELKRVIDSLRSMIGNLRQSHLMVSINSLGSLPTLPSIYQNVVKMIEKEANAAEIARIIETDPAIAAKLLRVANTAYYGSHTGSVQQAIMMLGMINVRQIILTNTLFESAEALPYGNALWRHAALTNQGVAFLYHLMNNKALPAHAGVVGLMHTIGLLLLATIKTDTYKTMLSSVEKMRQSGITNHLSEIERATFGITHQEIGSFLLNWWELPFDIVEAAYHYRTPIVDQINNVQLTGIVHLVSHLVFEKMSLSAFQFNLSDEMVNASGIQQQHQDRLLEFLSQQAK